MKRTAMLLVAFALFSATVAPRAIIAQEKPALVPLKLQLVLSRVAGEKKISSLPYTLWVTANERRTTNVRMGVQVPIISSGRPPKEGEPAPPPSYNYQQVGTSIDCTITTTAEGGFQINLSLNDTSIHFDSKEAGSRLTTTAIAGVPAFRNFTSQFSILMKDGQTAQYTSATDPLSGEVLKVDLTLNVLK